MATTDVQPITLSADLGRVLWRAYRYLRPYRRMVARSYGLMVLINLLVLLLPQVIRWTVDRGIQGRDVPFLMWAVTGLVALTVVKGFMTFWQDYGIETASQTVAYDLRRALHQKLTQLSFAYHDQTEAGQLLSRAMQDVERIRFFTGRAGFRLVEGSTLFLGTAVALMLMNPRLGLLALATTPLLAHRAWEFGRVLRPLSLAIQQSMAVLTTRIDQNLRGARAVKAFAQEDAEIARFDKDNAQWFDYSASQARLQAFNLPLLDFIGNISTVFIIWYGGVLVVRNELTLGELVAFTTYLGQLAPQVRRMGQIVPAIAQAAASAERIFEILDHESDIQEKPDAVDLPPVRGHIRFEDVGFAYPERPPVLRDIHFEAKPGQVIALLGATGSGKSSIINLVPRFYDPTEGRVLIDGYDLRDVTLRSLRNQIGMVLQESTLFAASLRENIAFGRPTATDDEVFEAARAAQAHDFIMAMPDGYETEVGERGVTLSGGQRQRVAIARALLTDPRILLLDDATSSVDTETERLIQEALERLMKGRTSIVIAQRLSTLRTANLILVLEGGRIAARGTHAELMQTSSLYAAVFSRQLRPAEDEVAEDERAVDRRGVRG